MTVSFYGDAHVRRLEDDRKIMVRALEKIQQHSLDDWTFDAVNEALDATMFEDFPPKRGEAVVEWGN